LKIKVIRKVSTNEEGNANSATPSDLKMTRGERGLFEK
jgi:hypothetical protein